MLVKEFIIKDILNYELENDMNIIEELSSENMFILHDLFVLGNKCSDDEADKLIEDAFNKYGFDRTFEYVAYDLIGRTPDKNDDDNNVKEFQSFSEVLENFYNELQAIDKNLGLSDFWNLSTRYMYKYSDGLKDRYIFNLNKQSQEQFLNAETFLGLLFGKLKEPMQFNEDGKLTKHGSRTLKDKINDVKNHKY